MSVVHFASPAELRAWLKKNQSIAKELWIGFWRMDSKRTGLTYSQALDEMLCFGWIDGVRKKVDAFSYTNRFTPRKTRSHWSNVNIKRVEELIRQKRMTPSGLAAYETRDPANIAKASFEQKSVTLSPGLEKRFRSHARAWTFFEQQAPYYRRIAIWWIVSAKREETQLSRLTTLITDSAAGRRLAMFTPKAKKTG
jgi:uncharacterized protein YdeI (YjbR/CyaY-like superfamily)